MESVHRLKRKLLREAVSSNLETSEERRQRRMREKSRPTRRPALRRRLGTASLLLLPLVILSPLLFRPVRSAPDIVAAESVTDTRVAPEAPATETVPQNPDSSTFPAPTPIDASVLPLAIRRVVLDPGHGGEDLGTVDANAATLEKDLTLDIARRLDERLQSAGFEVHLTREQDEAISLRQRVELANQVAADIFVSIHLNWIETREVRGVETYFLGTTEDPVLSALAQRENQRSGYTMADMRQLLESIYADVRQEESRRLAHSIQGALYGTLTRVNPDLENRGVKTAPFLVLIATEMPAVLAEVSCLSNVDEVELLGRDEYREEIAAALFRGIESYARMTDRRGRDLLGDPIQASTERRDEQKKVGP